ncbi:MAG: TraR/DksA C4-type zinc finger protein [Prevotella sp.]|nr:TraR/DksA C4-type zinc finger protein [Bacteroides sp.]MCM1365784.1 TraR/DksA C4-type zinc finger protein [Prevotella sp.]MCM1436524.1 TraR/DksA C4-type zinc finger protein [Prevotella sp.]
MAEELKRYSDAELEEFRVLIEEKLAKARNEYNALVGSYDDTDGTENRGMSSSETMEESTTAAQKAEVKRLADRQLQFIQKLKAALVRIDNKTYGICRVTGNLIPKDRLRAVPHATLSIEAKSK